MKTRLLAFAISTSIATSALAAPSQYLCITDQAAGLHYDTETGAWVPQTFSSGTKYILRRLTKDDWNEVDPGFETSGIVGRGPFRW